MAPTPAQSRAKHKPEFVARTITTTDLITLINAESGVPDYMVDTAESLAYTMKKIDRHVKELMSVYYQHYASPSAVQLGINNALTSDSVNNKDIQVAFLTLFVTFATKGVLGTGVKPWSDRTGPNTDLYTIFVNSSSIEDILSAPGEQDLYGQNFRAMDSATGTFTEVLNTHIGDIAADVGVLDVDNLDDLAGLSSDELDTVILPLVAGRDVNEIKVTKNDLNNFLQCFLITNLLEPNQCTGNRVDHFMTTTTPRIGEYHYQRRLIPAKMKQPQKFMNYCLYDSNFKDFFVNKGDNDIRYNSSLTYELYLVKSIGSTVKEIPLTIGTTLEDSRTGQQLEWNQDLEQELRSAMETPESERSDEHKDHIEALLDHKNYHSVDNSDINTTVNRASNLSITFDGTNPSTARKDVKVELTIQMTSFANLNARIGEDEHLNTIKLYELITIPYGIAAADGLPGGSVRSQYSPDYNRLRLKVRCEILNEAKDDLILDLAVIGHEIVRNKEGQTELKINYRGYFESVLSMPFLDALADNALINERLERDEKIKKAIKEGCADKTISEIIKVNRERDRIEAKTKSYNSIYRRLFDMKALRRYTTTQSKLRLYVVADTIGAPVQSVFANSDVIDAEEEVDTVMQSLKVKDEEIIDGQIGDVLSGDNEIESYYFFLGDLLHVITDCIYEGENLRSYVKDLKLRFLVPDIELQKPNAINQTELVNPLAIPIDLYYFREWIQNTVADKGVVYYPAMTMIRDLMERMINNILYENCFGGLLDDEMPPRLRTTFFTDTKPEGSRIFDKLEKGNWGVDLDNYIGTEPNREKVFWLDSKKADKRDTINYCVIYMQAFNNILPYQKEKKHYNDEFIPTIKYGTHTTDSFISDVKFAKTSTPGLKEARYFNSRNSLSILSNVYDLTITLSSAGATTLIYPGQILNVILTDFGVAESNPHVKNTLSNIMGIGGYYIVKKVNYKLPEETSKYTIVIESKWIGTEATIKYRKDPKPKGSLEDKGVCIDIYESAAERLTEEADEAGDQIGIEIMDVSSPEARLDDSTDGPATRVTAVPTVTDADDRVGRLNAIVGELSADVLSKIPLSSQESFGSSKGDYITYVQLNDGLGTVLGGWIMPNDIELNFSSGGGLTQSGTNPLIFQYDEQRWAFYKDEFGLDRGATE